MTDPVRVGLGPRERSSTSGGPPLANIEQLDFDLMRRIVVEVIDHDPGSAEWLSVERGHAEPKCVSLFVHAWGGESAVDGI